MKPVQARRIVRAARSGVGLLCLGILLLVQSMAAVPALHQWLHRDADEATHQCAVTLFLSGQVHCSTTEVDVVKRLPVPILHETASCAEFVSTDVRLLPSRGPPA